MTLKFGKKYTYKNLCKELNIKPQNGKQTQQLRELKKKYDIVKHNNYYIVKKEYDNLDILNKEIYLKNKNYIEPMLYTLLYQTESNVLQFDMKDLLQVMALVNKDYHFAKWNVESTDKKLTGSENNGLKFFIEETEPMFKKIIKDVLKDMEDRQLIKIEEIPMYARKYKGEDGKSYTQIFEATDQEGKPAFLEAKRQAMKHFSIEHWEDMKILDYYEWHEAKKIMENFLKEKLGVSYFYYEYKLILNKIGINDMITNNFEDMRQDFNEYIINKVLKSKAGSLKLLESKDKITYTEALLDINNDLHLRDKL